METAAGTVLDSEESNERAQQRSQIREASKAIPSANEPAHQEAPRFLARGLPLHAGYTPGMSYDPRTIAFLAEVLFQPRDLAAEKVQEIHGMLFRQPELSYHNFQVAQDGIHLSNLTETPGSVSSTTFLPDRILIREELRNTTVEDFATRVVNISQLSLRALEIEETYAQQFGVRSLVTPRKVDDSRVFLSQHLMGNGEDVLRGFGRPIESVGLRYSFPQSEENLEVFQLRVESWNQDPQSLWIENVGQFNHPTQTDDMPRLGQRLHDTYEFVVGPVCSYVASFDR